MRVAEFATSCRPAFARHETFHPRFGWLRKAYEAAAGSPDCFLAPDATVNLGVGKNMVNAIRAWGLAFKILENADDPSRPRRPGVAPSELATVIFAEDGWDPYLEDAATLWLLHWQLLRPPCTAPSWWAAFNLFSGVQFDDDVLAAVVVEAASAVDGWPSIVPASIKKDVDCLIRMYTQRASGRQGLDDLLDCPFRELELVEPAARDAQSLRFNVGPKSGLVDEVVSFCALDYLALTSRGANSISVARLATDFGGPGRAFKLTEADLFAALSRVAERRDDLWLAEPAGLKQLYVQGSPMIVGRSLLAEHYQRTAGSRRTWGPDASTWAQELQTELAELEAVGADNVLKRLEVADRTTALRDELSLLQGAV